MSDGHSTLTLDEQAARWRLRHADGMDDAERALFGDWLGSDPAHAAAYARIEATWLNLDRLPAESVQGLVTRRMRPASPTWAQRRRRLPALLAVAACLLLAVFVGIGTSRQPADFSQAFATPRGQAGQLSLPDGSQVTLDSQTHGAVRYLPGERLVELPEGQALFEVSADAQRPFQVVAGDVRVTVLGTRFSVRHTASGLNPGGVEVAVQRGHVRVERSGPTLLGVPLGRWFGRSVNVELLAGQRVSLDAGGEWGAVTAIAPAQVATWRDGRLDFDDTPLAIALEEFARYGEGVPRIADAAVEGLRISGSFESHRLQSFLRTLPLALPVRIEGRAEQQEIRRAN